MRPASSLITSILDPMRTGILGEEPIGPVPNGLQWVAKVQMIAEDIAEMAETIGV